MKNFGLLLILTAIMAVFIYAPVASAGDEDKSKGDNKDDLNSGKADENGDGNSGQGDDSKYDDLKKRIEELKKKYDEELYTDDRFDEADADGDGYVSIQEAEDAARDFEKGKDGKIRFNMADKDGDGKLSLEEAKEQKYWEKKKAAEWKEKHSGDKDDFEDETPEVSDDNTSSELVDELINDDASSGSAGDDSAPDTKGASLKDRFDENKDGTLDDNEKENLKNFARTEILAKLDKNGDGNISEDEKELIRQWRQSKRAKNVVNEFDEDKDGKLNDAEKKTAKEELAKKFDLNGDGKFDDKEKELFRQFKEGKPMPKTDEQDMGIAAGENPPDWKANGARGKFFKECANEHPELRGELARLLKEHPEWKDDLVDKGERARWIVEHAEEYPAAAKAVFEWFDKNSDSADKEWMHPYAAKRLSMWAKENPQAADELKEFVKEHPDLKKDILGQDGLGQIMKNMEKYPELCKFALKYAKRHPDAPLAKIVVPYAKNKILEDNKDFIKETKEELKSASSNDEFQEAMSARADKIREKLKEEGMSDDDIQNEINAFEKKAKQEFKQHLEKRKLANEKIKKEIGGLDDDYVHQMKKDREEFRKQLIREYDDGDEIAKALKEYDEKTIKKYEAFKQDLREKLENSENWDKDAKVKADGKLSKEEKENIKGKLEKPDTSNKKKKVISGEMEVSTEKPKDKPKDKPDTKKPDGNDKEKEKEKQKDKEPGKPGSDNPDGEKHQSSGGMKVTSEGKK